MSIFVTTLHQKYKIIHSSFVPLYTYLTKTINNEKKRNVYSTKYTKLETI